MASPQKTDTLDDKDRWSDRFRGTDIHVVFSLLLFTLIVLAFVWGMYNIYHMGLIGEDLFHVIEAIGFLLAVIAGTILLIVAYLAIPHLIDYFKGRFRDD